MATKKEKKQAKRAARQEARAERAATQSNPLTGTAFATSIDTMLERQKKALEAGKLKKAGKIGDRIAGKIQDQPIQAIGIDTDIAQQEFEANIAANRPDQSTIGGTREYVTDPTTGQTTVKDTLSPEQQALYDQQVAAREAANRAFLGQLQGYQPQGLDFGALPGAPNTQDLAGERQRIEQSIYDRESRYLDQNKSREQEALRQQLFNRGVPLGQIEQHPEMQQFQRGYAEQYDQARSKAISQAGQEFERSYNIGAAGRSQALNEQVLGQQLPQQNLSFLAGLGGGPTAVPNFFGFQPIQYQAPQIGPYLQMGIAQNQFGQEMDLQRQQLGLQQQQLAMSNSGGGGGPAFSFGGLPPAMPAAGPGPTSPVQSFLNNVNR